MNTYEKCKKYIQKNYMKPLSLQELSDNVAFMNTSYLSYYFKKNNGRNFKEYLTEIRINKAMELIKSTDKKIGDIANEVGYIDKKQFYIKFRQKVGMSPTEYRKMI